MIGKRLLDLRTDADMTQTQLAEILRISKHSISAYEHEKSEPPDAIKIAIARHFGVSVDYLLGVTDDPAPMNSQPRSLRLPAGFPQELLGKLRHYAEYLAARERKA